MCHKTFIFDHWGDELAMKQMGQGKRSWLRMPLGALANQAEKAFFT
jgi:hypothetical protein